MASLLTKILNRKPAPKPQLASSEALVDAVDERIQAYLGQGYARTPVISAWDGEKFPGGMGALQEIFTDYWAMRKRSNEVFKQNLYAKGLIRRLVTNEINTGLTPDAFPAEEILRLPENSLDDWSEDVVKRFEIYGKSPKICDYLEQSSFARIQQTARLEAIISGDVLVVLRQGRGSKTTNVQLVRGENVRTPLTPKLRKNHTIEHGVELDARKRQVAYWIVQEDGTYKRLPAFGEKSGRRIAWLVYGSEKRLDEVRGEPLLALVFQSLKEIDRYRDSAQRKAVVNSFLALYIKKTEDKLSSLPMTGAAVKKGTLEVSQGASTAPRTLDAVAGMPGTQLEEMQVGEEIEMLGGHGTDVSFQPFEQAVISAVAWCHEIPPEILTLAFSNNYSASQAAINEFKIYLNKKWAEFGEAFCQPIYLEWLISEVLVGRIQARGLIEAWQNPAEYNAFGAWTLTAWYGSIKPSTDMLKQVKASEDLVKGGYSTRTREARTTTGTSFRQNIKGLRREQALLAETMRPMLELEAEFGPETMAAKTENLISAVRDLQIVTGEIADNVVN